MPSWSRRDTLRFGTLPALSLIAGCSQLESNGEPTGTPDPDAGTDQYGIFLTNDSKTDVRILVEVKQPWDENPVKWSKTLDLEVGEQHEWSSILTEQTEYVVVAHIQAAIEGEAESRGKERAYADSMRITPGDESAPTVENVRVEVFDHSSTQYPWVRITTE